WASFHPIRSQRLQRSRKTGRYNPISFGAPALAAFSRQFAVQMSGAGIRPAFGTRIFRMTAEVSEPRRGSECQPTVARRNRGARRATLGSNDVDHSTPTELRISAQSQKYFSSQLEHHHGTRGTVYPPRSNVKE